MTELLELIRDNPEVASVIVGLLLSLVVAVYKAVKSNETPEQVEQVKRGASIVLAALVTALVQTYFSGWDWKAFLLAWAITYAVSQGTYGLGKLAARSTGVEVKPNEQG